MQGGLPDGEARLGQRGIVGGQGLHEPQHPGLVLHRRYAAPQLQEAFARVGARQREQLLQIRPCFLEPRRVQQQAGEQLQSARGARVRFMPDLRRLDGLVSLAGMNRDLGGAARNAGIAGTLCEVGVGLRGHDGIAALPGDLGEQELVEYGVGELVEGQLRAIVRAPPGRGRVVPRDLDHALRIVGTGRVRRLHGTTGQQPERDAEGRAASCPIARRATPG
jgi:hypothetical protein